MAIKPKRSRGIQSIIEAIAAQAGGLANVYYLPAKRAFSLTMSRSAIANRLTAAWGLVNEFYPDITHRLFRKNKSPSPLVVGEQIQK